MTVMGRDRGRRNTAVRRVDLGVGPQALMTRNLTISYRNLIFGFIRLGGLQSGDEKRVESEDEVDNLVFSGVVKAVNELPLDARHSLSNFHDQDPSALQPSLKQPDRCAVLFHRPESHLDVDDLPFRRHVGDINDLIIEFVQQSTAC